MLGSAAWRIRAGAFARIVHGFTSIKFSTDCVHTVLCILLGALGWERTIDLDFEQASRQACIITKI